MQTIQNGYTFQLNADGTELICGYQQGCKRVNLVTGEETPWTLNGTGEWYPCGFDGAMPAFFQPLQVSPPTTGAFNWTLTQLGKESDAVGHAGLAVIDGRRLSTNGQQLFLDGVDITPEPFLGVVWDDTGCYGAKRGWDGSGPFVVRRVSDNGIAREIDGGGMWERCYTLTSGLWTSGQYPGGSRVDSPL